MASSPRRLQVGERTYLRTPSVRDQRAFLKLVRGSRKLHGKWVFAPQTPKEFKDYLTRMRKHNARALLVCRLEDDAIVGVFNLSQIVRGPLQSAYLGYWAFSPSAGLGYMTEGLRLCASASVWTDEAAPSRSEHPAAELDFHRTRETVRLPQGGFLSSVREARRPLA